MAGLYEVATSLSISCFGDLDPPLELLRDGGEPTSIDLGDKRGTSYDTGECDCDDWDSDLELELPEPDLDGELADRE